jgi:signal transduction histidine kinase
LAKSADVGAESDSSIYRRGTSLEIAPLVNSLNRLIVRLEATVSVQKHFVTAAAHELPTLLTTPDSNRQPNIDNRKEDDAYRWRDRRVRLRHVAGGKSSRSQQRLKRQT